MTAAVDYPLVGSYNNQRVTEIDAERSVNCFEYIDPLGKKQKILLGTSGILNTELDFGANTGAFRALYFFSGKMYAVVGGGFYLITQPTQDLVLTSLGTLNTSAGYVSIDANTYQLLIVDGQNGYVWDTTSSVFQQITDSSFPAQPIDCCVLDNFGVVAAGGTNNFLLSEYDQFLIWGPASNAVTTNIGSLADQIIVGASNIGGSSGTANYVTGVTVTLVLGSGGSLSGTGLTVNTTYYAIYINATHIKLATTYANAFAGVPITLTGDLTPTVYMVSSGQLQEGAITSHPGTIVACNTLHRRLFLFSQFFTEVWENQGIGTTLPFRRNNSFLIEYGTPSTASVAVGFDKMYFLSQDRDGLGSVMQVVGVEAVPVSTRALDFQLAQYAQIVTTPPGMGVADAKGFLIKENGLIFYRLNFTTANHTFVYNVTLSNPQSDETKLWHEESVLNGNRHPAQVHAFFNGSNYYGSYNAAILYLVDVALTTNDGEAIHRMRIGKAQCPGGYQRTRIDRFQVDLLQGQVSEGLLFEALDLLTENGSDLLTENSNTLTTDQVIVVNVTDTPNLYFSYSKDGGQSYGSIFTLPMGNVGQRTFRTVQRKLGVIPRGQAFVPKIEYYDQMPFCVLGAAWVFEVLPE